MKNFVFTDENLSVTKDFMGLVEHCTKGKIIKGKVSGLHFYDKDRVKITKILKINNSNGVFEAEIEFYDIETKKWIKKEKNTTFFPLDWSLTKLFHQCLYAVNNKLKKKDADNVYISKTECGINVEIIEKQGLLKSIYPIL